ncbi:MAG: hypothetical protein V1648_04840 [Candidatus Aenigmatarchaeota archaeon]
MMVINMVQRLDSTSILFGKYIPEIPYKGHEVILITGNGKGNVMAVSENILRERNPVIPAVFSDSVPEAVHAAKETWDQGKNGGKYIQV